MFKKKILRIIPTLDKKYGGPVAAIIDSSLMLSKQGFKIDILTNDLKNTNFYKSKKINIINTGPAFGRYNFNIKLFIWLFLNRNKYDAFIIHGLWQFHNFAARVLLKKKYFVFTHGMLDPFFSGNFIKKTYKQIYWFFFEKKNLLNAKSILLTSNGEKESLKKTFVNTEGITKKVIRYGINKPNVNKKKITKKFYKKFPILKYKKFYLFLGRYHEKKGCEIIIKSINKIKKNFKSIVFFAGPMLGGKYEIKIKNLVKKYELQDKILFSDALFGDLKWGAINASKAMVLSSHGENFGVSLVESMSFGKPVITTNKVGIANEILKSKAGYVSKNKVNQYSNILKKFENLKYRDIKKLSKNASSCFEKNFNISLGKNNLGYFLKKNI